MTQYKITTQQALGSEIKEIVEAVEPALVNKTRVSAVIALLSIAILLQEPSLDSDDLQVIIKDISQRIAFLIEHMGSNDEDKTVH